MEDEFWRYTFDEDGNMVERRCRTTLLAQTERAAGPLLARNEVSPRADMDLSLADIRTDTTAPLFSLMPHTPVETSSSRPAVFITHPVLQAVLTTTKEMVHRMSSVVGSGVQGAGCAPGERHVFVYNTENTLMGMYVYTGSTLTYEAHYAYDPLGRRIEKREIDHTGGKTIIEQYVYRDEDIVFRVIVDPNTGERAVKQVYTHGELAVDDPVAFSDCPNSVCSSGGWSFLGKDQVQSVETVFRPNTFQTHIQDYSSFGLTGARMFQEAVLFQFTSRERGPLMYMYYRARIYDTIRGQFLGEDPLSDVMKGRIGIKSLYVYVRNHPLQFYDPYGYQATSGDDVCSWRSGQNGELCPPDCTTKFTRVGDPWCDCPPPSQRKQCPLREPCYKNLGNCIEICGFESNPFILEGTIVGVALVSMFVCPQFAAPVSMGLSLWQASTFLFCTTACLSNPCLFM